MAVYQVAELGSCHGNVLVDAGQDKKRHPV
jgi:hypothetical protein